MYGSSIFWSKIDDQFVSDISMYHIYSLSPKNILTDCVFFDSSGNFYKMGRVVEDNYTIVSVLHVVEHFVTLFFMCISNIDNVSSLIIRYKLWYNIFGSGAIHVVHIIFKNQAHNFHGNEPGMLREFDTQIYGYFVAISLDLSQSIYIRSNCFICGVCGYKLQTICR